MPDHFETVAVRREGRTLQVLLQRPQVRNAFDARMISELTTVFEEAAADDGLRCLLLRGDGPVFCAGADVNWMRAAADYSEAENREDARRLSRLFQAFIAV
ncbi:MAG: enoyl-CoA hydratase-related protein, partial [Planctomycetota bacterium]|nr:enoyl-CoA hydratase-related protein [Planctomycetota bacterium]